MIIIIIKDNNNEIKTISDRFLVLLFVDLLPFAIEVDMDNLKKPPTVVGTV